MPPGATVRDVSVLLAEGGENDLLAVGVQEDVKGGRGGGEVEEGGGGHAGCESELRGGGEGREGEDLGRAAAWHGVCLFGGTRVDLQGKRVLSVDQRVSSGQIFISCPVFSTRPRTPPSHPPNPHLPPDDPYPLPLRTNANSQLISPDWFAVRDKERPIAVMSSKPSLAE